MRTERSISWRLLQILVRPAAALLFDLKVYGRQHVPDSGGVLIVSNHQSNLDPILLPLWLTRPLNFIAKSQLFRNRLFGWLLVSMFNAFPVRHGRGDVRAVKETIQRLQNGHLMNIFPEGRRTLDGEIGTLQRGVALIVKKARVAIVPAVIVGAYEAWPIHRRFPRRGRIRIVFGPRMEVADLEDDKILAEIEQTLRTMYAELRAQVDSGGRSRLKARYTG